MPLFEAVVNSIHAIEEANLAMNVGSITIHILRGTQQSLDFGDDSGSGTSASKEPILGFRIVDNGIGFNDENMASFRTLDSEHKAKKGGRGVGRLLWLKAFKSVSVESVYEESKTVKRCRKFCFNAVSGVKDGSNEVDAKGSNRSTTVSLEGFEKRYREASLKTVQAIANSLFEHCLWYFIRAGSAPNITLVDADESISLNDVYESHMASSAVTETVEIKKREFAFTHIRLSATSRPHAIALCAASRLVREESLTGKIPGLFGKIDDGNSQFVYLCYVASDFLDEAVRAERTDFDIAEESGELFTDVEISLADIRQAVIDKASLHLASFLTSNLEKSDAKVEAFVSQKAPRYRPIMQRIREKKLAIDPNISEKELELTLHKQYAEVESQLIAESQEVMAPKVGEHVAEYRKRLESYLKTAEDIKNSQGHSFIYFGGCR